MKQLYKYILTLATIFMATTLNAQTYNNGTWYSLYDANEEDIYTINSFTRNVFAPTTTQLQFEAKKTLAGAGNLKVAPIIDGSQQSNIYDQNPTTSYETYYATTPVNFNELKFYTTTGATLRKYVNNIKLPLAKHILLDDGTTYGTSSKSLSLGNVTIGNISAVQTVKLRSFHTAGNITITSNNAAFRVGTSSNQGAHDFNVGANACASANGAAGTPAGGGTLGDINLYDINIYFVPTTAGEQSGTITITDGTSTAKVTVTGTGLAKETQFAWTIANTGADIGTFYVGDYASLSDIYTLTDLNGGNIKNELHSHISFATSNSAIVAIENGQIITKSAGEATITATFSDGYNGWKTFTKTLTLTIKRHDLTASMNPTAVWNQTITDPFTVRCHIHSLLPGSYTVTSLTPDIATYDATTNTIQTYFTNGTASFQITRPEDDKFNAINQIVTLHVNQSVENCPILEDNNERSWSTIDNSGSYTIPIGTPDSLFFQAKRTAIAGFSNTSNFYAEYSTDNSNWTQAMTISLSEEDTWYNLKCDIPETAKYVRFMTETGATGNKHIRNVRVTRKQFLNPQIDGEIFYLTQTTSGMQFAGTFPLEWSTCSDNISLMCDNPNFTIIPTTIDASDGQGTTTIIVAYSTEEENPNLTGTLTIYDQSQTKQITLSCEHMLQTIDWPQYFYNLEADENGYINEDITLNAIARTVTGQPTNQPIHYTLNVSPANASLSTDANGNTHLNITGICEGTITASVEGFTDANGRTYSPSSLIRQIRIRKAGDPCHSYALYIVDLQTITLTNSTKIFSINGLPENTMTFIAHTDVFSTFNDLSIDFSKDGNNWGNKQTIDIQPGYEHSTYSCSVPDSVSYIRFKTSSTLGTYFDMVTIRQKEYLTPSVEKITISDAVVNQPFSATFTVDYSDVPFIQYQVTNSNNLNLKLTPSPEINNNCGEYGTYTFTLTGMSPYPQENVQETITIFTSAGHRVKIPVIITSHLSDPYYFNQIDGDWNNLENWRVNNAVPTSLPTPSNPVIITKAASIGTNDTPFEGIAYSIDIQQGGSITVLPKGGLTVHAGGFTGASEQNLTIHNTQSGAGFIRISPYFTKEVTGTMPTAKVLYQTKSTLDTGANKDATWQYIGAPGTDCSIYVDYNTWLYKLDEPNADWVLQPRTANVALEPFEGYAITQYGQPTYQWTAQLTNQSQTLPLTYSKAGRSGRHIFANSFAAPIDVKQLSGLITYADGQDSRFRIEQTVYIFNSGAWNAWNTKPQMGDDTPGQYYAIPILAAAADYLADEQTVIPPMQGFYMRVRSRIPTSELSATENVGQILLDYNKLVMGNQHELNTPLRLPQRVEATPDFQRVRMYATSANSGADRLYVIQDTINTRKYNNGYDAPNQETKGLVNIYTNESFGKMEVSCSDNIDSLYIGFMAGEDSNYTLHFGALCGEIYLKDLENDSIFLMQDGGQYSFTATPNSTNDLRFQILLHPDIDPFPGNGDINSSINNIPSMQVWMDDNTIYIANAPINSVATLFNISGHAVLTTPIRYTPYSLNLSHMPQGVYVLKINNEAYKFVCK